MDRLPQSLQNNAQCVRYFRMWSHNQGSIVFVPLAEILRENRCFEEARTVCEIGLRHNPESISGRLILASVYWALDQSEEARRVAQQVLERMPGHPEAQKYVAPRVEQGPQRGEKDLRGNIIEGTSIWHTPTMADILVKQGEYEEAARIVSRLLKSDPKNRELRRQMREVEELLAGEEKTVV